VRNTIFIGIFCSFVLLIAICAPVSRVLSDAGILENENVGNVIEVERVYEEGQFAAALLNRIEEWKREIRDVYTNYIPFYVEITSAASGFQQTLNRPVTSFLLSRGNALMLRVQEDEKTPLPSVTRAPETVPAVPPESADSPGTGGSLPVTEETAPPAAETEPVEEKFQPVCSAVYLKSNTQHRYYKISAKTAENEPATEFYVRIPAKDAETLRPAMEKQLEAINALAARRPEVNWYVFPVTCFEDTVLCDELLPAESKKTLFDDFFAGLAEGIQADYLKITSYEEKDRMYYKTDHHWNVYGFTEGYRLIAEMFQW